MTALTWTTEKRKVSDLKAADYNPRKSSEQEERDLEESIDEFGAVVPVVVNVGKRAGVIIGGHFRTRLYAKRGVEEIDVMVPSRELSKEEEKRLNLRLNKNQGSWDYEKLKEIDLTTLLEVGFGDEDLQDLFDDVDVIDDDYNVQRALKEIKKPRVKLGEIWKLGDHRLMVGDSVSMDSVGKLMGDELADIVYCDPPYNIGLDYNKGVEGKKSTYGGEYSGKKDSKKEAAYAEFVSATMENALAFAKPNCHAFYWCDEKYIGLLQTLFRKQGCDTNRVCLWIKNNSFPKPQVAFNKVYEPCVYATRGKPYLNRRYNGPNEIMNKEISTGNQGLEDVMDMLAIWTVPRDASDSYLHPTQKPVPLNEKPLKRVSAPGQIVLDLFAGSGSTLMACEQLRRKCYTMEHDPLFATIVIDRWEKFTNQKAVKK